MKQGDFWLCDVCGTGNGGTRFHNHYSVHVGGETDVQNPDGIGEDWEWETTLELCDRCARGDANMARALLVATRRAMEDSLKASEKVAAQIAKAAKLSPAK